jgi:hypothetical protein
VRVRVPWGAPNYNMAFKCSGSTAVSKTVRRGSIPWRVAKFVNASVAEALIIL